MSWADLTEITDLKAWYKADEIGGLSDGDPVTTWSDSSGNSVDLSQTGSARPTYKTSIINGLPVVRFDGSDDLLSSSSFSSGTPGLMFASVFRVSTLKDYNALIGIHDSSLPAYPSKYLNQHFYASGHCLQGHNNTGASWTIWNTGISAATTYILSMTHAQKSPGVDSVCSINGRDTHTINSTSHTSANQATGTAYIHLGYTGLSASYFNGDIAELVVFRYTSDREWIWIEGYLADKYGLTLAVGHPFKESPPDSAPPTYNSSGGGLIRHPGMSGGFNA